MLLHGFEILKFLTTNYYYCGKVLNSNNKKEEEANSTNSTSSNDDLATRCANFEKNVQKYQYSTIVTSIIRCAQWNILHEKLLEHHAQHITPLSFCRLKHQQLTLQCIQTQQLDLWIIIFNTSVMSTTRWLENQQLSTLTN